MRCLHLSIVLFVMKRMYDMLACAGAVMNLTTATLTHHHLSLSYPSLSFLSLVEDTLEPLDPDRRAFRLVGGVLVSLFWSYVFTGCYCLCKCITNGVAFCFRRVGGTYRSRSVAISQRESSKCK
jgi:hypothetical protein